MELDQLLTAYKHKTEIQVRFKDIDKQGHVNNAVHLTYFEIARTAYFKSIFRKKNDWIKTGIILANAEVSYKRPILLEDSLYCYSKVTRFGTKSFDMENAIVAETEQGMVVCVLGKTTLVCMDYDSKQTIEVPKEWIKAASEFENNPSFL